jgi:hypothetical protein
MIEIKVSKTIYRGDNLAAITNSEVMNFGAEALADELKDKLKDAKCKNHPDKKSILVITPETSSSFKFDKSGFCCKEFSDSVTISDR